MESFLLRRNTISYEHSTASSINSACMGIDHSLIKADYMAEVPIKTGWGFRCHCLKSDTKAFFVLYSTLLQFFPDNSSKTPFALLNFNLYSFTLKQLSKTELKISALSQKKTLKLKFPEDQIDCWTVILTYCISISKGGLEKIFRVKTREKFWLNKGISEEDFLNKAENGDLLLFRSKNSGSKLQRCLTWSKYDHVGLILRFENKEIGFIEASRAYGVVFTYWDRYFKQEHANYYEEIAYRKLEVSRTSEMLLALESFTKAVKGKAYSLGLTRNKGENVSPGNENTFFCSELVASAYKTMGILDTTTPSYNFYPSDFTSKSLLSLLQGSLQEEMPIDMGKLLTN